MVRPSFPLNVHQRRIGLSRNMAFLCLIGFLAGFATVQRLQLLDEETTALFPMGDTQGRVDCLDDSSKQSGHKFPTFPLCSHNPYVSALNDPLSTIQCRSLAWLEQLPAHYKKALGPEMQEHDWERFFPFEPLTGCLRTSCVGGECFHDESKVVCGLEELPSVAAQDSSATTAAAPPCVVYSLGSNNKWTFELDMLKRTNCIIHTFDCSGPRKRFRVPSHPRLTFHYVCLGTEFKEAAKEECTEQKQLCGEMWTLADMQKRLGHDQIDLLKMDIELYEWDLFESWYDQALTSTPPTWPMQILVEIHYRRSKESATRMVELQEKLVRMGYTTVVRDDNKRCLHCTELTLVRTQCPDLPSN